MKVYRYYIDTNESVEVTDQQILYDYWQYWEPKMVEKYGENSEKITHENCINDWVMQHGAVEK